MGFLDKIRSGLKKTKDNLIKNIETVVIGYAEIDDDFLEELEMVLLSGDLGVKTTDYLMRRIRRGVTEGIIHNTDEVMPFMEKTVAEMLAENESDVKEIHHPEVYLVVGVAVAFDAVTAAKARGADVVLIDTAGRLQTKVNLMEELAKISRVVKKVIPDAPHQTILILDATTGQNAVSQAKSFGEIVPLTGVILTKLDGTAKGGVVLSVHEELHVPVQWIGLGEREEDLQKFNAADFAKALFETDENNLKVSTKI